MATEAWPCTCNGHNPDVVECLACGATDCPNDEPLHYHHDGCPACDNPCNTGSCGSESDDRYSESLDEVRTALANSNKVVQDARASLQDLLAVMDREILALERQERFEKVALAVLLVVAPLTFYLLSHFAE